MIETPKRLLTSKDLWKLRFIGDPELSKDQKLCAWVETWINARKNSYESAIWISRKGPDGRFGEAQRLTYGMKAKGENARDYSPRFSPDGRFLAFLSNRSQKVQIWLMDLEEGGEARQLTKGDESVSQIAWSWDSKEIAYVSLEQRKEAEKDRESSQKNVSEAEIRTDRDVTCVTKLRYKANGIPGVLDPRPRQVFVVRVEDGVSTQLTYGDFDNTSPTFSPDGTKVAFTSCREPDREIANIPDLWVIPRTGGEPVKLTCGKGPVMSPVYSPDGKFIAFLGHEERDDGTANTQVLLIPSEGGKVISLCGNLDRSVGSAIGSDSKMDPGRSGPFWSADSKILTFIIHDKGITRLYQASLEQNSAQPVRTPSYDPENEDFSMPPCISSMAFSGTLDAHTILFIGSSPTFPGDVYAFTQDPNRTKSGETGAHSTKGAMDAELTRITQVNKELLDSVYLSKPRKFLFKSSDGLELEGWMMKPIPFSSGKKYPSIIEIHGGPHSAYGETFYFEFQLLASKGYGVFYCNPRGSAGYGQKFGQMVIGDWGGMDYQDIMALKDVADQVEWVDAGRVGVTGGSYGGYMTNWIVGHTHRFKAAVTQRSISNMYTKYGTSDIGFYANKRGMGGRDLWDSESFLMERSPIRYAPNVKTPILILHSEQDYRCPMEQAEQWYVALKRLGKEVGFVRFAGENHELSGSGKPHNRVERLERIVGWFDKYLKSQD